MRLFHLLIFDNNLEGATQLYTEPSHNALLASVESLSIFIVTDTVSGTSLALTVQIEESPDQVHWNNKAGTAEINGVDMPTSQNGILVVRDNGTVPSSGFIRLRVQLGGTTPKAHIRIWVTGRGEQPV